MSTIRLIITSLIVILSIFCILIQYIKRVLQDKGIKTSFSISGLFTLKNLRINIHHRYLSRINLSDLEFFFSSISLRFQYWKLIIILHNCKCSFFIVNKRYDNNNLNNDTSINKNLNSNNNNNRIGIIRNLLLIVIVQIISRITSIQFKNIQVKTVFIDCNCNNDQIIQDDKCILCGMNIRYGLECILNVNNLNILTKAYLGGIIVNFSINNPYLLLYPIENTLSKKRCNSYYLDINNKIDKDRINHNIMSYILDQFKKKIDLNKDDKINMYPPLLFIKDDVNINMKLMHSMSGSDIRVCNLRNMNIELNDLWMTIIPEIICEFIYIYRSLSFGMKSIINNIKIDDKGKKYDYKEKSIINENIDEQLTINCKIMSPNVIFCDNTSISSGFELVFNELEAHFTIQYFVEYIRKNVNDNDYNEDNIFENLYFNNNFHMNDCDLNFNELINNQLLLYSKKSRRNINIVIRSKFVIGNSILYIGSDKRTLSGQIMSNSIIDKYILFDKMFVVDQYKSIIKISDNNSIRFYFKNSIQKMFGIWKENGFYQNLSLFLQLTKFYKYLLKLETNKLINIDKCDNNNNNNNNDINNNLNNISDFISDIPERVELNINDVLKNDFIVKDYKYLNELRNNKDIMINLLFYFDIKELTIQTNNIYLFNNELMDLKKDDISNDHCEKCFIESFGPINRYDWDLDNKINENNKNDCFVLTINNLQLCNTSLNRNFSMLFNNLKLYIMNEFIDLEDISIRYFQNYINKDIKTDLFNVCVHKYGCIDQRIKYFQYKNFVDINRLNKIVELKELLVNNPWDHKKTSLKFLDLNGILNLRYIPFYLYILGCYSVDSLALKQNNLYKVYYGVNNEFEGNFDYYCKRRSDYYDKFNILKYKFLKLINDMNPEQIIDNNINKWDIPDVLLSKSSLKYTWYFDFENISVTFYSNFKLIINKLSLYRCNEYGNYDILINDVNIIDSSNLKILNSNSIRLRSDIPYETIKIKSPICLKKQLRRLLDLSINGDLLFLSILGNQSDFVSNFDDINNGLIYFDSKRFILQIDYLKLSLFNDNNYLEPLFKYLYQYVYITYYQLFHPPLIIRYGKLLSYLRKNPIVFSCNNLFDFVIKNFSINIYRLDPDNGQKFCNSCVLGNPENLNNLKIPFSKDDILLYMKRRFQRKSLNNNQQIHKILDKNLFNTLIMDFNLDYLKIHIRTKHTSNTKSHCNDNKCYNIPNYLLSKFDEETFLINSEYNPINIFGYSNKFVFNLYNSINYYKTKSTIYSRKEFKIKNEYLMFDLRRYYVNNNDNYKELTNVFDISIYSKSKTILNISNLYSYKIIETLYPLIHIVKDHSKFKSNYNVKYNSEDYQQNYKNTFINKNQMNLLINMSDQTLISIIPYIDNSKNIKEIDYHSSLNIVLPNIYFFFQVKKSVDSFNNLSFSLLMKHGFYSYITFKDFFNLKANFCKNSDEKKVLLNDKLLNISKLSLNILKNSNSEFNIEFLIDGLDRELFAQKDSELNAFKRYNCVDIPLTIDLDIEKSAKLYKILQHFFDKNNFFNQFVLYCRNCMEFKYFKSLSDNCEKTNGSDIFMINNNHNILLNLVLNNIHVKYEIFGLVINNSSLFVNYKNNEISRFNIDTNEVNIFAECYPYKYSLLTKSSKLYHNLHENNIQISSNYHKKTKIIKLIYIGKIIVEFEKKNNILILIDNTKLSFNMLCLIYLDVIIKLINYYSNKNSSDQKKPLNNHNLLGLEKFNIQILNILVNIHNSNFGEVDLKKNEANIYAFKEYYEYVKMKLPSIDYYDELLSEILNKSPINSTFNLVEDHNETNVPLNNIFKIKGIDCIDCINNSQRLILHSSKVVINNNEDYHRSFRFIIKNYVNNYYNYLENVNLNFNPKFIYRLYNDYRKATIYNDNTYNNSIEYGELIRSLFFEDSVEKYSYLNRNDQNYLFKQVIFNVPKVDFTLKFFENKKFELILKIMPISINTFVSNKLIWNLFISDENFNSEDFISKDDERNDDQDFYENLITNTQFNLQTCKDSTSEVLKTTPIYINIRILREESNTYLKTYSNSLFISIDSNKVQIINEILASFEYRNFNTKLNTHSTLYNCTNFPSSVTSSNTSFNNNINNSNISIISTMGNNLPPPIYYSHNNISENHSQLVSNQNINLLKTPSTLSFSNYLNDHKQINYRRIHILNLLNIDRKSSNICTDLNFNKSLTFGDLNDKNINNILKYEIDKYLINNPLCYTMIDNVQNQPNNENSQTINNKLQIECIIDKLNIDMFILNKRFSNFQSTDINLVLLSNNNISKSTIIEFDTSSISLVASKEFIQNNNLIQNPTLNDNNLDEEMSIIYPMYIDGHTNEGHGHVLSVRINMRQIKLLELFNIKILESIIIRINPIKVNITQYLTSCYYDIFFPSQDNINIHTNSNTNINDNNVSSIHNHNDNNINMINNSTVSNNNTFVNIDIQQNITNNSNNIENESDHILFQNQSTYLNNSSYISSKNILYFNYLRISSILVEVTYRGSVSLNKVLLELGSFTQRRKCRTVKEMIDKYISFIRRQAARPVISYTFKQLRHSLLPKQFKSSKRNSNYNTHYNYLYNDNHNQNSNKLQNAPLNINSSQNDILDFSAENEINNGGDEKEHPNHFNRNHSNSSSRNDSEYNKFRLLFGNQLLL